MALYVQAIPSAILIVCTLSAACQDGRRGDSKEDDAADTGTDADTDTNAENDTDIDADTDADVICDNPDLIWRTANKTWYTSYPDPGSDECIDYNGCEWAGWFAGCTDQKTEDWVAAHNIVAAFPDFAALRLHDLCLRKGASTIIVTVLDTCADSDCDGCCTENLGDADQLIDIESYTNARWGVSDGRIEWADLGLTKGSGCD